MGEFLYEILHQQFSITREEFEPLRKILKVKSYKKGDAILKEGEVDGHINYMEKGIVHQYVMMNDGIHTVDIKLTNMTFNSLKSYVEGSPSKEIQEAVTDVKLLYFTKADFDILMQQHLFCFIYAKSLEQIFVDRENRTLLLQHKSASDRFRLFIETNPNANRLLLEAPQKLLANYLAMAPETFSKVKKEYFLNFD